MLLVLSVFFSSRRRHTICALVTGVQTCALPIYHHLFERKQADALLAPGQPDGGTLGRQAGRAARLPAQQIGSVGEAKHVFHGIAEHHNRTEERRVGKEWVSTFRSRWSTYPSKKNTRQYSHSTMSSKYANI